MMIPVLIIGSLFILVFGYSKLSLNNDIRRFYTMSETMARSEDLSRQTSWAVNLAVVTLSFSQITATTS